RRGATDGRKAARIRVARFLRWRLAMKTGIDRRALVSWVVPLLLAAGCGPLPQDDEVGKTQQAFVWGDVAIPPGGVIYLPPPPPPPPCLSSSLCERSMVLAGKKVRFFSSYVLDGGN